MALALVATAIGAPAAASAEEVNFFELVRSVAGGDQVLSKAEFRALIPAGPDTPSDADFETFYGRVQQYGGMDAAGNLKVEPLINMIVATDTVDALSTIADSDDEPVSLLMIAGALPAGLAPATVKDFLLSIDRTPGGTVARTAAETAIYAFVGGAGNTGRGELGQHVAPVFPFYPTAIDPITAFPDGTSPANVVNAGNIFANVQPGIYARTGTWNCGDSGCTSTPGGAITINNSGTVVAFSGEFPFGIANAIEAETAGSNITIGNSGIVGVIGDEAAGISARSQIDWDQNPATRNGNIGIVNSGLIQTEGVSSAGISATVRTAGRVTVENSGAILSASDDARGIEAESGSDIESEFAQVDGGTTVRNSGLIEMGGVNTRGISTHSEIAANLIENSGRVEVSGAHSQAIMGSTSQGSVTVRSSGQAIATGADSAGIFAVGISEHEDEDLLNEQYAAGKGTSADNPIVMPLTSSPGAITVDVTGGTVQGGSGGRTFGFLEGEDEATTGSAGIMIMGGTDNVVRNAGTITALNGLAILAFDGSFTETDTYIGGDDQLRTDYFRITLTAGDLAVSNLAAGRILGDIVTGSGDDHVANAGLITGAIDLGAGANAIDNLTGGVFNAGARIALGAGNTLRNAGSFGAAGTGTVGTTTVVGNFVQTAGGRLVVDINDSATALRADRINVTGTAALAGIIAPNVIALRDAPVNDYVIVSAAGGTTTNGLAVNPDNVIVRDTVAYDFSLSVRNSTDLVLSAEQQAMEHIVDVASGAPGAGNTAAVAAVGTTLTDAEDAGGGALQPVLQAVRNQATTPQAAANALNRLVPQQQSGQTNSTNSASAGFSNAMLSCASRNQPYAFTKEETCYYAKFTARQLDRDATTSSAGHDERGYEVMGGAQVNLGGELRGGFALGYEDTSGDTFSTTQALGTSDGSRVHAGFVLKNQWGPINAYLNLAGSYGWYDHTRFVNMGGFTNANGDQDVMSGLIKLRLSYLNDMGGWYLKPLVDVGATYVNLDGYTETGAGAFNLKVASTSAWLFSVSPALELGGEIRDASGTLIRPYIRGGVTVFDKDNMAFSANFASAPVGVAGFSVVSELDRVFADVAAGVQVLTTSGVNVKLEYDGRFASHTQQNAGTVKVTLPY